MADLRGFYYSGGGRRFFGFKKFFGKLFEISGRLIFWGLGLFFERSKPRSVGVGATPQRLHRSVDAAVLTPQRFRRPASKKFVQPCRGRRDAAAFSTTRGNRCIIDRVIKFKYQLSIGSLKIFRFFITGRRNRIHTPCGSSPRASLFLPATKFLALANTSVKYR